MSKVYDRFNAFNIYNELKPILENSTIKVLQGGTMKKKGLFNFLKRLIQAIRDENEYRRRVRRSRDFILDDHRAN